jgi:transposase
MGRQGSTPYGEDVRLRAVRLVVREGWKPSDVAQSIDCSTRSVQLWVSKSNRGRKTSALQTGKAAGATPKLCTQQKQQLIRLLKTGPLEAGFPGQLWTCLHIATLIEREFGVTYSVKYLPGLLKSLASRRRSLGNAPWNVTRRPSPVGSKYSADR